MSTLVTQVAAALRKNGMDFKTVWARRGAVDKALARAAEFLDGGPGRAVIVRGSRQRLSEAVGLHAHELPMLLPSMLVLTSREHLCLEGDAEVAARTVDLWVRKVVQEGEPECAICWEELEGPSCNCRRCFCRVCLSCTAKVAKTASKKPCDNVVTCPACSGTSMALRSVPLRLSGEVCSVADAVRKGVAAAPKGASIVAIQHPNSGAHVMQASNPDAARICSRILRRGGLACIGVLPNPGKEPGTSGFIVDDLGNAHGIVHGFDAIVACMWARS